MLKYKCLLCGIEWGDPQATGFDVSHGYCPACIRNRYTERIRQAQLRAGYSDCFNRGHNDCSETSCCFRAACQDELVASWKERLLAPVGAAEMEASDPEMPDAGKSLNKTGVESIILRFLSEIVCKPDWYEFDQVHREIIQFIKEQGLDVGPLSKKRLGKLMHDLDIVENKERRMSQGSKIMLYFMRPEKIEQVAQNYRVR
jgi:hypothetical protein